jgi:hypothetical protein
MQPAVCRRMPATRSAVRRLGDMIVPVVLWIVRQARSSAVTEPIRAGSAVAAMFEFRARRRLPAGVTVTNGPVLRTRCGAGRPSIDCRKPFR